MNKKNILKKVILNKKEKSVLTDLALLFVGVYFIIFFGYVIYRVSKNYSQARSIVSILCIGLSFIYSVYRINSTLFNFWNIKNLLYLPINITRIIRVVFNDMFFKIVGVNFVSLFSLLIYNFSNVFEVISLTIVSCLLTMALSMLFFIIETLLIKYIKFSNFIIIALQFITIPITILFVYYGIRNINYLALIDFWPTLSMIFLLNIILWFIINKLSIVYYKIIIKGIEFEKKTSMINISVDKIYKFPYLTYTFLTYIRNKNVISVGLIRMFSIGYFIYRLFFRFGNILASEYLIDIFVVCSLTFIAIMNPFSVSSYSFDKNIKCYKYLPIRHDKLFYSKVQSSFCLNLFMEILFLFVLIYFYHFNCIKNIISILYGFVICYLCSLVGVFLDGKFYLEKNNYSLLHGNISKLLVMILFCLILYLEIKFMDLSSFIYNSFIIQGILCILISKLIRINVERKS